MVNANLEGSIAANLRTITEQLMLAGGESPQGLLGGEYGYGVEYTNDVFEMHPFHWGDCTCGFEQADAAWGEANPHAADCYQEELARRGVGYDPDTWTKLNPDLSFEEEGEIARQLAAESGLDAEVGTMVHCDCYVEPAYAAWRETHNHDPRCPVVRPNFRHLASGFEVRWYKYIGRSMEFVGDMNARRWAGINAECIASIPAVIEL